MSRSKQIEKIITWTARKVKKLKKASKSVNLKPQYSEAWTCDFGQNLPGELSGIIPCVIVQDVRTVVTPGSVVVIPIILQEPKYYTTNVNLSSEDVKTVGTSYFNKGTVIPHQIRTVSKARLGKKIGVITEEVMLKVSNSLRVLNNL
ncbi:type II toxin-antitoxin system PemK/MazF family toxin (plasmid) [Paenibacillus thiaminolyticus]|uniref:type II toxin-antitoxin system PemK/MazF family toxin n=1 Tax=Paenibacillus thiaminolyticus TaxID=49283 RepID=UPI00232B7D55|nr:type II toxin-antitoxin system PemK/MazF family toxin [Paenibacillus thiaminolyticus]WCF11460.1 type II toxin-antitoxin system PemK/MazF family toxin [Paenibacillus thiaminolyticus]